MKLKADIPITGPIKQKLNENFYRKKTFTTYEELLFHIECQITLLHEQQSNINPVNGYTEQDYKRIVDKTLDNMSTDYRMLFYGGIPPQKSTISG